MASGCAGSRAARSADPRGVQRRAWTSSVPGGQRRWSRRAPPATPVVARPRFTGGRHHRPGFPAPYSRAMARRGRPAIGDRIAVRLPVEMIAELDARAAAADVSRAEAVRILLDRALATGPEDGVDRTQIARRLALTPRQRVRSMAEETRRILALTRRAR